MKFKLGRALKIGGTLISEGEIIEVITPEEQAMNAVELKEIPAKQIIAEIPSDDQGIAAEELKDYTPEKPLEVIKDNERLAKKARIIHKIRAARGITKVAARGITKVAATRIR